MACLSSFALGERYISRCGFCRLDLTHAKKMNTFPGMFFINTGGFCHTLCSVHTLTLLDVKNCHLSALHIHYTSSIASVFLTHLFFLTFFFFQKDEVYLNLVLDYVPETVYRVARHYSRAKQTLPMIFVKVGDVNEEA